MATILSCNGLASRLVILGLFLVGGALLVPSVKAQGQAAGQYQSIPLVNVNAAEAAGRLSEVFGQQVDVIPDATRNRLLISASQPVMGQAVQLVQRLDRPITTPASYQPLAQEPTTLATPSSQRSDDKQVVAYSLPANDLKPMAAYLRSVYKPETGLWVAIDDNQNHLIVIGDDKTQAEIAAEMKRRNFKAVENQDEEKLDNDGRPRLGQGPNVTKTYQLKNIGWRAFETAIVQAWGDSLKVEAEGNYEVVKVTFPLAQNREALMQIDRRNGRLTFNGPEEVVAAWEEAVRTIDVPAAEATPDTRWVRVGGETLGEVQRAVSYMRLASAYRPDENGNIQRAIAVNQDPATATGQDPIGQPNFGQEDPQGGQDETGAQVPDGMTQGLIGPVQIEFINELGIVIVKGAPEDVAKVQAVIDQITSISTVTKPVVELRALQFVEGLAVATVVQTLYDQVYATRQGAVTITPLLKPNALMIVGREEAVNQALELVEKLDQPVASLNSEFKVFDLKYMSAQDAANRIREHYLGITPPGQNVGAGGGTQSTEDLLNGLAVRVRVTPDYRSNRVIVSAGPRDLEEIEEFIKAIDVAESGSKQTVMFFRLRNALAEEAGPVLQDVLSGQLQGGAFGFNPGGAAGQQNLGNQTQNQLARVRSAMLQMMTFDAQGQKILTEGAITYDVRVTVDQNSNALIIAGPIEVMDLVAKLVEMLDRLPEAETFVKVYNIKNADASKLLELFDALFNTGNQGGGGGQINQLPLQSGTLGDSSTLVALRFAIDTRTNSLIVSGSEADLNVIESILIYLDENDLENRETYVKRLHSASAEAVATAVNAWLDIRAELNANEDLYSIYQQNDRAIIVVSEPNSNSLIISATRDYLPEIQAVIESLDRRPPMVMVKILLAQVQLGDTEEFGIEAGLQDSIVFDRGASNIGFNFNQSAIGNDLTASSLSTRENVAAQGLSNLNIGRTNSTLGFGGLVLTAGNESVSLLLRALKQRNRLQILSSPEIMTLENVQGFVQIGQRVPYITDTSLTQFGQTNSVEFVDVGVLVQVQPRVSPDGLIVMDVDATKSQVGNVADGIPISINQNGDVIRSPRIDIITAVTTVMARSGQTVVLGGLIESSKSDVMRGVPILSDIPGVGQLFRFDQTIESRSELLIIMTPYVVESDEDIELMNQVETDRMSWCWQDVAATHGNIGVGDYDGFISMPEPATIYPDIDPTGTKWENGPVEQIIPMPESGGVIPPNTGSGMIKPGATPYGSNGQQPTLNPATSMPRRQPYSMQTAPASYVAPTQQQNQNLVLPNGMQQPRYGDSNNTSQLNQMQLNQSNTNYGSQRDYGYRTTQQRTMDSTSSSRR